jgi:hypothetical protein
MHNHHMKLIPCMYLQVQCMIPCEEMKAAQASRLRFTRKKGADACMHCWALGAGRGHAMYA